MAMEQKGSDNCRKCQLDSVSYCLFVVGLLIYTTDPLVFSDHFEAINLSWTNLSSIVSIVGLAGIILICLAGLILFISIFLSKNSTLQRLLQVISATLLIIGGLLFIVPIIQTITNTAHNCTNDHESGQEPCYFIIHYLSIIEFIAIKSLIIGMFILFDLCSLKLKLFLLACDYAVIAIFNFWFAIAWYTHANTGHSNHNNNNNNTSVFDIEDGIFLLMILGWTLILIVPILTVVVVSCFSNCNFSNFNNFRDMYGCMWSRLRLIKYDRANSIDVTIVDNDEIGAIDTTEPINTVDASGSDLEERTQRSLQKIGIFGGFMIVLGGVLVVLASILGIEFDAFDGGIRFPVFFLSACVLIASTAYAIMIVRLLMIRSDNTRNSNNYNTNTNSGDDPRLVEVTRAPKKYVRMSATV